MAKQGDCSSWHAVKTYSSKCNPVIIKSGPESGWTTQPSKFLNRQHCNSAGLVVSDFSWQSNDLNGLIGYIYTFKVPSSTSLAVRMRFFLAAAVKPSIWILCDAVRTPCPATDNNSHAPGIWRFNTWNKLPNFTCYYTVSIERGATVGKI